ncbi:MAG: PT domain-containing protein, partial [Bradymonadales bacterium]|nr:PT domain-containing protein [Bradymonadales bacterium]
MAAVRPIDLSARRGALLTGIPLLVGGLAPINMEPLTFLWDVAAQTHSVRPLLIPAAGLMITAVGLLPGLPRLVRGLLILLFVTVPGYFSFEMLTGMGGERAGAFLHSVRGQLLVASIGVAAVTEMMVSWKKTSKVLAGLAMVGWLSFVVLMSLPGADGKLLVLVMFDGLTNLSRLPGILPKIMAGWVSGLPLLLLVFGVLGGVFALIRLVRSSEGMLRSFYRSGWAGILMAGSISLFLTGYLVLGAIALEVYEAILPAVGAGLMLFGLCVGVTAGLAHTLLGLMSPPGPIVVEDFVPGMVGQPKAAGEPQPYAHPAFSRDPTPDQMFARQPYGQPLPQAFDQPPAQPFGQAPAQPFAQPPAQP